MSRYNRRSFFVLRRPLWSRLRPASCVPRLLSGHAPDASSVGERKREWNCTQEGNQMDAMVFLPTTLDKALFSANLAAVRPRPLEDNEAVIARCGDGTDRQPR